MQISTRGRYALRAMLDLALHNDEGPVLRHAIATRQELSADYVAQLFQRLCAMGLVKGVKGPGGGYRLARDPATIRVGDIVRAVEGPIAAVQCVTTTPGSQPTCHRAEGCTTRALWVRLSEVIAEFLDAVTLKELCDQARQLNPGSPFDPYRTVGTLAETAGQLSSFNGHCALLSEAVGQIARQPSRREASLLAVSAYTYEI
jgi:Rrf2 family cysteine metabolism transcriptional repressor